jgi:hypothetical protein
MTDRAAIDTLSTGAALAHQWHVFTINATDVDGRDVPDPATIAPIGWTIHGTGATGCSDRFGWFLCSFCQARCE